MKVSAWSVPVLCVGATSLFTSLLPFKLVYPQKLLRFMCTSNDIRHEYCSAALPLGYRRRPHDDTSPVVLCFYKNRPGEEDCIAKLKGQSAFFDVCFRVTPHTISLQRKSNPFLELTRVLTSRPTPRHPRLPIPVLSNASVHVVVMAVNSFTLPNDGR